MNNLKKTNLLVAFILCGLIPFVSFGQEDTKEKKKEVHMKTVKMVDGKKVVKDTTFSVSEIADAKDIMKKISWVDENDSSSTIVVDVMVDSDDKHKKVSKIKVIKDDGHVSVFTIDEDEDGEHKVIMTNPASTHSVWHAKEGDDHQGHYEVIIKSDHDIDMDFDMEEHEKQIKVMKLQLDEANKLMIEDLESLKELEDLGEIHELNEIILLKELEELEGLKEMNIEMIKAPKPPHAQFYSGGDHEFVFYGDEHSHGVSEKELRDAGIKNKVDKLEIEDIDIDLRKGILNLDFSLKTEGVPKVVIYNYFGDKVFSGKPDLSGSAYKMSIDLSTKQNGKYYLMIVQKNASFTEKFKL